MSNYYVSDVYTKCIKIMDNMSNNFGRLPFAVPKGVVVIQRKRRLHIPFFRQVISVNDGRENYLNARI